MALRLVNTAPGDSTDPIKPGDPLKVGVRSETLRVTPSAMYAELGYTNIMHHSEKPEDDESLTSQGATVEFETAERVRPIEGTVPATIGSGNLILTKGTNNEGDLGIYEVSIPIETSSSILGYFKFRKKSAWSFATRDWCNLSNMTGMYFGLELGTFNTGAFAFLRSGGGLVVGGPLPAFGSARSGQVEYATGWDALADDAVIELFLFFNLYASPFHVEVWIRRPADASPVLLGSIPIASLGTFPAGSSSMPNRREGVSNVARLFFGNAGSTGDILQIDDWALFPDYRVAMDLGLPTSNHDIVIHPDAPVVFDPRNAVLPEKDDPGRWFKLSGSPQPTLYYQAGQRRFPAAVRIQKNNTIGYTGYEKVEPRIAQRSEGVMVEAFMSVDSRTRSGVAVGSGVGVEDGLNSYRLVAIESATRMTYGVAKDDLTPDEETSYYTVPDEVDFRTMKIVRLVVDRLRPTPVMEVFIDDVDTPVLTEPLASTFPASAGANGRILMGNLLQPSTDNTADISWIRFLNRYFAWEGRDNLLPDDGTLDADVRFTEVATGTGSSTMSSSQVVIEKSDVDTLTTERYFSRDEIELDDRAGIQIDFRAKVDTYTDDTGRTFAPSVHTGAGLRIYLGNKRFELGFYDCGIHGKKIAVLPGSGTVDDILNQTTLGKAYSSDCDWSEEQSYRIVMKAYEGIQIWVGPPSNTPAITIAWDSDQTTWDLPLDATPAAIAFGHFDELTSSTTRWSYMRWGISTGYDLSIAQKFPAGLQKYLFGGKVFLRTEFDEA